MIARFYFIKSCREYAESIYTTYIDGKMILTEEIVDKAIKLFEIDIDKALGDNKWYQIKKNFELCKSTAKYIYTTYIEGKVELSEEGVDEALTRYEFDHNDSTEEWTLAVKNKVFLRIQDNEGTLKRWELPIVRGMILQRDFRHSEWYLEEVRRRNEWWEQKRKSAEGMKKAHEKYLMFTDKLIEDLKEDILKDKLFLSKLRVYNLTLALQKEKRHFKRRLEKEDQEDTTFPIMGEIDPKDFLAFKEACFMSYWNDYRKRNNINLQEGWDSRIKREILRFMKTID